MIQCLNSDLHPGVIPQGIWHGMISPGYHIEHSIALQGQRKVPVNLQQWQHQLLRAT